MNINYISRFEINDELLDVRNKISSILCWLTPCHRMYCMLSWHGEFNTRYLYSSTVAWIYFSTVCSISFPSLWASRALDLFHSRIVVSSPCTKPHLVRLLIIITNNIKSGKNLKGTDLSWSRISTRMESWSREMVKSSVWWKSKLRLKCNINCEIYCHILLSFYLA